ncbi:hypothetical protein AB1Y20_004272 [Prymnesium parvum]|uniref:DAGKc domain-containing protein n=1 Tax=Prymnesium parvum TaxID=97485 RepID=A0AB34J993_PRYPA|mmetsp:Transcript_31660/g.78889  ORF Transcript_31660/g.78889 Transcript_31660/m.78889 type:complete len:355 (-) Transcript_31660:366-1430(-)
MEVSGVEVKGGKGKPPLLAPFLHPVKATVKVKRIALVYNPYGGKKRAQKLAETIVLPLLRAADIEVEVHTTSHAGHEAEYARTLDLRGFDALVGMGGDGTISSLLSGFLSRSDAGGTALGFIPAGTGNTYVREVLGQKAAGGCESAVRAAVSVIIAGHTRRVDAFRCEMRGEDRTSPLVRHALNTVMLGFGPDANAVAERRRWLGPMRYSVSIKTEIMKLPFRKSTPCTMKLDGEATDMDLFLIALQNNKHTGIKHRIAPKALLDDGKVDVLFTSKPVRSILKAAKLDAMISSGGAHIHSPIVSYKTASCVEIETQGAPQRIMLDGDIVGFTPLKLEVLPLAFSLFTPENPAPT